MFSWKKIVTHHPDIIKINIVDNYLYYYIVFNCLSSHSSTTEYVIFQKYVNREQYDNIRRNKIKFN